MEKVSNEYAVLAESFSKKFKQLEKEVAKKIIGQDEVIRQLIISIFCNGHSLLVGVPGLAKTLLIQTFSNCLSLDFKRIQFTPDLMPSDILGAETLDKDKNLRFIKGPIFANVILADEINRTPPKTQSALLEAMQEKSVTIAGEKFELGNPFFVLATQNPIEQEGTYPLPEAQLDRFMFMIKLDYPKIEDEKEVIKQTTSLIIPTTQKILEREEILQYQAMIRNIPVSENVFDYVTKLINSTRPTSNYAGKLTKEYLEWGAGTRAGQFLIQGARCHALINDQFSPDIDNVKAVATPILRHRIVRNFKAEAENISEEDIIRSLI